jgi:pyruvate dehydrogenase E2 component (dihydrolipoamide acetyltransferase)
MEVTLPKWGVTMQQATVTKWYVTEGDAVQSGQPIADLETDKVEVALEAPVAGTVSKRCVNEGDVVKVGALVAVIDEA